MNAYRLPSGRIVEWGERRAVEVQLVERIERLEGICANFLRVNGREATGGPATMLHRTWEDLEAVMKLSA